MRKRLAALVIICGAALCLGLWLLPRASPRGAAAEGHSPNSPSANPSSSSVNNTVKAIPSPPSPALASPTSTPPPGSPVPTQPASNPQFTNISPPAALEHLRRVFHQYASMFGGNPVGTNPEITAALNGDNPKQANFIDPDAGMRIDAQGNLIDPWGVPYFFHQLSGQEMEIHCAGPDHKMWTADDLIIK